MGTGSLQLIGSLTRTLTMPISPTRQAPKPVDPKTEEIRRKLEQLKARRERRADTRRKILVGAVILAQLERGEIDQKKFRAMLDKALIRKDDRALFGLPGSGAR